MGIKTRTRQLFDYLHKRDCDVNIVKRMISSGVNMCHVDKKLNTSLHIVIRHCDDKLNLVRELLVAGAPLDVGNSKARSAVHFAVMYCDTVDVLKELIAFDACIYLRDRKNNTPLHLAVTENKASFVKVLLDHKPYLHRSNKEFETPLCTAVRNGNLEIVKMLLSKGACVKYVGKFYRSALHLAMLSPSPNQHILVELMRYESEMHRMDYDRQTPLKYAIEKLYADPSDGLLSARTLIKCSVLQFKPKAEMWFEDICEERHEIFPQLDAFYEECVVEKKKMKFELIHSNFYLLDFVRLGFELAPVTFPLFQEKPTYKEFIFNKVLRASMKYSIYTDIIAYRLGKVGLCSKAMEIDVYTVKECLAGKQKIFLTPDSVFQIAGLMSEEDVLNFIIAFSNSENFATDDSEFENIPLGYTITHKRKRSSQPMA